MTDQGKSGSLRKALWVVPVVLTIGISAQVADEPSGENPPVGSG